MTDPLLIRPKDAAELLGLSRSQVYELIASGELTTVRIGRGNRPAHRIETAEISAFIERNRRNASNGDPSPV